MCACVSEGSSTDSLVGNAVLVDVFGVAHDEIEEEGGDVDEMHETVDE